MIREDNPGLSREKRLHSKRRAETRMKRTKRTMLELIAIAAMATAVLVLGMLQYRWTTEISSAEQERLKAALGTSIRNLNQQFAYDFERLGESFEIDPEAPAATIKPRVLRQYSNWTRNNSRPELVANLHLWTVGDNRRSDLESLDPDAVQFQRAAWPEQLKSLEPILAKQFETLPPLMSGHDATYWPWTFYGDAFAIARPIFKISSEEADSDMKVQPIGFLVVQLDPSFVKERYFPDLVDHYFGSLGFRVAVRSASPASQPIYLSDPAFPISSKSPDADINLFDSVGKEAIRRGRPPVQPEDDTRRWQLVAQYSSGSLETAVAQWRKQNLVISLGLLAILAGCVMLVLSVARRAERLAEFQMDFVAGFSHELCTPLAVVNSAVENLADGVVDKPEQVREYVGILQDQSARVERLLDQVLRLASRRFENSALKLRSVEVTSIVARCIAASEPALRDAGITLRKEIEPDLPLVMADPAALGDCVENLISNAMKYGSTGGWIAVWVRKTQHDSHCEVLITVEDRGIGIPAADQDKIFDPFYRTQEVRESHVRGAGLGLYLVKQKIESMGGRVTVSSKVGRGSCFTLHFPVVRLDQESAALRQRPFRGVVESLSTYLSTKLSNGSH
jgi:signal transduction histidine kinase